MALKRAGFGVYTRKKKNIYSFGCNGNIMLAGWCQGKKMKSSTDKRKKKNFHSFGCNGNIMLAGWCQGRKVKVRWNPHGRGRRRMSTASAAMETSCWLTDVKDGYSPILKKKGITAQEQEEEEEEEEFMDQNG